MSSFQRFIQIGMALDPIHVGTGGARIGRVDLTIVREPATRLPKIPGSSLAGVYRTYVAMAETEANPSQQKKDWPYFPHCAGLGQGQDQGPYLGHCRQHDCPVCTVFGFASGKDQAGGFAGLAAFSDAQILLFPVPTRRGPHWITCPMALRQIGLEVGGVTQNAVYLGNTQPAAQQSSQQGQQPQQGQQARQVQQAQPSSSNNLNLGWLLLDVQVCQQFSDITSRLVSLKIPSHITDKLALVPDHLFAHIVNSNLEVRTSVSINPTTGAAEEGALFSYEALPRGTVLVWDIIAKYPKHFKVNGKDIDVTVNGGKMDDPAKVHEVVKKAHPYLEHLGIGGMGTRGMGRLTVLHGDQSTQPTSVSC